jgi:hypothetical protein
MFRPLAALILTACAALGVPYAALSPRQTQHRAMHWIVLDNGDHFKETGLSPLDKAGCTANALSEHVLLTAQHCDIPDARIYIDGSPIALAIDNKLYDGADHMLLVIPVAHFKDFIQYSPDTYNAAFQGEHVYFWGNPRAVRDQYREGICTGTTVLPDDDLAPGRPVFIFSMPAVPGDSGSSIFSAKDGRLVAVLTYGVEGGKFAAGYALRFTNEQLAQAGVR